MGRRGSSSRKPIRILSLGGVGEIGKNLTIIEYGQEWLIVDVGLAFPDEHHPGVDLVLPDFTYLTHHAARIAGIVLTHGHEDHIGGLPYLLQDIQPAIYATPLTLGLLRNKLQERNLPHSPPLHEVRPGERRQIGCFEVEFIQVTHSMPDCVALGIRTPAGTIVHTGDFKFDRNPVDGRFTDLARLGALGDEGVHVLLSDCTNVEKDGISPCEREVREVLRELFLRAAGRIIASTFASNIHRIQQIIQVAEEFGRKVAVAGRSMEANLDIALRLGYLEVADGTLVALREVNRLPDNQVVILCTGSQGEPLSVMVRLAHHEHGVLRLRSGDLVIISATPVPGNEETVSRTINALFRAGAEVVYPPRAKVHVTGHAHREDLKLMLNLIRPRFVLPVHGEPRHLFAYSQLAQEMGISADHVLPLELGEVLEISGDAARIVDRVPVGSLWVKAGRLGEMQPALLEARQQLAQHGLVIVTLAVNPYVPQVVAGPEIQHLGLALVGDQSELWQEARQRIQAVLCSLRHSEWHDRALMEDRLRRNLDTFLRAAVGGQPLVLPVVMVSARTGTDSRLTDLSLSSSPASLDV